MELIRVGAGVVNQTALDWSGNRERLLAVIHEANDRGVQLLCLPELAITGYGCEDAFFSADVTERSLEMLTTLAKASQNMITAVGLPIFYQGALYNAAALIGNGRIFGLVAKQTLAGDGIHYEPRWFKAWPANATRRIQIGNDQVPIGDLVFDWLGVRIGFEICEDAWVAQRPGSSLASRAVDLILNPSASHFAFGKHQIRQRFVLEGSRAFHTTYIYTNLLGNEAGRAIYDGGPMIAHAGLLVAAGPRFTFRRHFVIDAVADVNLTRMHRVRSVGSRTDLDSSEDDVVQIDLNRDKTAFENTAKVSPQQLSKEEEFTQAMTLGLYDYMTKSFSRGFVVSLSGGADSAACATLVSLMVDRVSEELGTKVWKERTPYLGFTDQSSLKEIKERLLHCVYQKTVNSSEITQEAAATLAHTLGASFSVWDIDPLVNHYRSLVESSLQRKLSWDQDDITLQNIQARVRSPGIWMLANALGALLLATSNRSEAAVGYATMDGDTSGGLSPIAGVDKAFLQDWLRWLETTGSESFPAIPELNLINRQSPTAELRPQEQSQTDEADLMPYPLLDAIECAAIRDKRAPEEVFTEMESRFPHYDRDQLRLWIKRFFQLWSRNQWKRERYAPSFHLDDKNLDPKTWCRFPILSGGFREELEHF